MKPLDIHALEQSHANVEQLTRTVQDLLAFIKRQGGHVWPDDQALFRRARAELVEMGKSVNREDA